jgi:hypothetical protein
MSLQTLQSFTFLKSSRFLFQFTAIPDIIGVTEYGKSEIGSFGGNRIVDQSLSSKPYRELLRNMTFLCDSIEFPGQSLSTLDYRIPGTKKLKVPYLREYNEITASFYYPENIPMYEFFSSWVVGISKRNTATHYFDEITGQARVTQFAEGETVRGDAAAGIRSIEGQPVYLTVNLKNMYPINFASLQSNWGDDGFQKMSVTFFFEDISLETYSKITPPPAINPILGNYNKSLFSKTPNQTEADRLGFANSLKIDVSSD